MSTVHILNAPKTRFGKGKMERSRDELNQEAMFQPPNSTPQPAHGASSALEKVLCNTSLPPLKRLWVASWIEIRLLFRLAAPAVMVYFINSFMSISTRIFSGHLGNLEFAAASLGNQGIQLFAYGLLVRMTHYRARRFCQIYT